MLALVICEVHVFAVTYAMAGVGGVRAAERVAAGAADNLLQLRVNDNGANAAVGLGDAGGRDGGGGSSGTSSLLGLESLLCERRKQTTTKKKKDRNETVMSVPGRISS